MKDGFYQKPERIAKKEEDVNDRWDFSYLYTERELMSWETKTCCDLRHAVTVIELSDISDTPEKNSACGRLDSLTVFFALRGSCETLRICAHSHMCTQCDAYHASLFKGLRKSELATELPRRIESMEKLGYFSSLYRKPTLRQAQNGRYYIEYRCPMLGYRELVFPIIVEGDVLGVLFIGQFRLKEKDAQDRAAHLADYESERDILRIRESFLEENPGIFEEYIKNTPGVHEKDIRRVLLADDRTPRRLFPKAFDERIGIINDEKQEGCTVAEYQALIQQACMELENLEHELTDSLNKRRRLYVREIMRDAERAFNDSFPALSDIKENQLEKTRRALGIFLSALLANFSFSAVTVLGGETMPGNKSKKLTVYARKEIPGHKPGSASDFDPGLLQGISRKPYTPLNSKKNPGLFQGFSPAPEDVSRQYLLVYPTWAVLFEADGLADPDKKALYKILMENIEPFLSNVLMAISTLHSAYLKEKFELTLHMYKHECTHIALDMAGRNKILRGVSVKGQNERKRRDATCEDLSADIFLINNIATIIGSVVGSLRKESAVFDREEISLFKSLLYKWDKAFGQRQREKNLSIFVPEVHTFDEDRPYSIYTSRQLLEIVLYNLLDNAVKYCHWGSNIYADFRRVFPDSAACALSIRDYGFGIEPGERPYTAYYRQDTTANQNKIQGDGLGLYAVKKICELLDMRVSHSCKKISEYNVPLMREYIERELRLYPKDAELVECLRDEERKLRDNGLWDIIINRRKTKSVSDIDLTERELTEDIREPTHEVCFTVEISLIPEKQNLSE